MSEQVLVSRAAGVCEVRFNRPEKRNALTFAMYEAFHQALSEAQADEAARVLLVSGAGAGFCAGNDLQDFLAQGGLQVEPVTAEQAELALEAYQRYGKGRHRAGLNFGDCFAYALCKATGQPLLFKGQDFSQTDIATVPRRRSEDEHTQSFEQGEREA